MPNVSRTGNFRNVMQLFLWVFYIKIPIAVYGPVRQVP